MTTPNSELDLATLEKACQRGIERFIRLKKYGDMARNSDLPAYENFDDDTTVPISFKEIDAIAARMVKLYKAIDSMAHLLISHPHLCTPEFRGEPPCQK